MRWLVRLVCPPNGTVLDPFAGSGTTLCAAALEGANSIGIEMDPEYAEIAKRRIAHWSNPDNQRNETKVATAQAEKKQRMDEMATPPEGVSRKDWYKQLAAVADEVIAEHQNGKHPDTLF